jgi:hypothetical protein
MVATFIGQLSYHYGGSVVDLILREIQTMCEKSGYMGTDRNGKQYDCGDMFNCCDCGNPEDGCGCSYCFSCNACEECLNEE